MEKFLKPKEEGMIVRDPVTKIPLSSDGEFKTFIGPEGRYWRRRVKCGDCIIAEKETLQERNYTKKKRGDQ